MICPVNFAVRHRQVGTLFPSHIILLDDESSPVRCSAMAVSPYLGRRDSRVDVAIATKPLRMLLTIGSVELNDPASLRTVDSFSQVAIKL